MLRSLNHRATTEIRWTGNRGFGVFAAEEIQRGTVVANYSGKPRWIWDIKPDIWKYCFQIDFDLYVVPRRGTNGWFINHSCEPNCVIAGERKVSTARDVKKGEELTFDYSTNVGWDGFAMECRCEAKNCRRTITSYFMLSEDWKKRYGTSVSPFLLCAGSNR